MLLIFFGSCSSSSVGRNPSEVKTSPEFAKKISEIKEDFSKGDKSKALQGLFSLEKQQKWSSEEEAVRLNFIGVILFSDAKYEEAEKYFLQAINKEVKDPTLKEQIRLNLASSLYRRRDYRSAEWHYQNLQPAGLNQEEQGKYHLLGSFLAKAKGDREKYFQGLFQYFNLWESVERIKNDHFFRDFIELYFERPGDKRDAFIKDQLAQKKTFFIGILLLLEAENDVLTQQNHLVSGRLSLIKDQLSSFSELVKLANEVHFESDLRKYNFKKIGVILPLSGKKKKFADDALEGINSFFDMGMVKKEDEFVLSLRDSNGSGIIGAQNVEDLAVNENVGLIIGGLFSDEAKREYLMAKKYLIPFVSLSPIYLNSKEKDYLLLEVPGSSESMIRAAFSEKILKSLGDKVALFIPADERGTFFEQIAKEEVKKSNDSHPGPGIEIIDIQSFPKDSHDFREVVSKILDIKNPEFQKKIDEFVLAQKTKGKKVKREDVFLPPEVKYQWILTPAYPDEAIKILPTFNYFNASKIPVLGGPSWRNKSLFKMSQNKKIFFLGNELNSNFEQFAQKFFDQNQHYPNYVEIVSYSSMEIAWQLLQNLTQKKSREAMTIIQNEDMNNGQGLQSVDGHWGLVGNLWIKDLELFDTTNSKVNPIVK